MIIFFVVKMILAFTYLSPPHYRQVKTIDVPVQFDMVHGSDIYETVSNLFDIPPEYVLVFAQDKLLDQYRDYPQTRFTRMTTMLVYDKRDLQMELSNI